MTEQPMYVPTHDDTVLVGIPTLVIDYISDEGTKGTIFLEGGRHYWYREENDEHARNCVEHYGIEHCLQKANDIICSILNNVKYTKEIDRYNPPKNSKRYTITKIDTVYRYESQPDGTDTQPS